VRRSTLLVVAVLGAAFMLGALWLLRSRPAGVAGPNSANGIQRGSGSSSASHAQGGDVEPSRPPAAATSDAEDSARVAIDQAPPGARVLLAVDERRHPILDARAILLKDRSEIRANAAGLIVFEQELGPGKVGLVGAEGRQPRFFELVGDKTTVELPADVGLPVLVLWKQTGEPAVGAVVRRISWATTILGTRQPSTDQAFDKLVPREFAVDAEGKAVVHGCNLGHFLGVEVSHPEAPITLLDDQVIGRLEREDGWEQLTVQLDRELPAYLIECVDPSESPIANRPISILVGWERYARTTDSKGQVALWLQFPESVKQFADSQPQIEVDLSEGKYWIAFRRRPAPQLNYVISHRRLSGAVDVQGAGSFSAASAALWPSFKPSELKLPAHSPGYQAPELDRLEWQHITVGEDHLLIERGWQGERTGVLLRDDTTGLVVDLAEVDALGSFQLHGQFMCRLEITRSSNEPVPDYPLEFRPSYNPGFQVTPSSLPKVLDVPRAVYFVRWCIPGEPWELATVDATGPAASVALQLGQPRWISGSLSGRLRGPMDEVELLLKSEQGQALGGSKTSSSGEFRVAVKEMGAISIAPIRFPDEALWSWNEKTFWLAAGQDEVQIVLPEACLQLEGKFSESLAEQVVLRVRRIQRGEESKEQAAWRSMDLMQRPLYLAPGEYKCVLTLANTTLLSTVISLRDDETRQLELPPVKKAMLEVELPNTSGYAGVLVLSVQAPDGTMLLDHQLSMIPIPPDPSHVLKFLSGGGIHRVEVAPSELRRKDDPSEEIIPFTWEWSGDCKMGEATRVRIPLE
jgi:hypothetical protein